MRIRAILVFVCCVMISAQSVAPVPCTAQGFRNPFRQKTTVEQLAERIDGLESHIETYGSVVAKKPDIWGESRLMRHRHDYETELATRVSKFEDTINASIQRSDQAFLASALSLQAAISGRPAVLTQPGGTQTETQTRIEPPKGESAAGLISGFDIITRTDSARVSGGLGFGKKIALEPVESLNQLSRYLQHLNHLRRLNEGGDNADAPGYALQLFRIPVSVLPGKKTRRGYGAEITINITPVFGDDFLRKTFRDLVINDVADQLALPLTRALENPATMALVKNFYTELDGGMLDELQDHVLKTVERIDNPIPQRDIRKLRGEGLTARLQLWSKSTMSQRALETVAKYPGAVKRLVEQRRELKKYRNALTDEFRIYLALKGRLDERNVAAVQQFTAAFKGGSSRRQKRLPLAATTVFDVLSTRTLGRIAFDAEKFVQKSGGIYHYADVRKFVITELQAAYGFLNRPKAVKSLWEHCSLKLATYITQRRRWLTNYRYRRAKGTALLGEGIAELRSQFYHDVVTLYPRSQHTTTTALSWAIIVECSMLSDRLNSDMRETARRCGGACGWDADTLYHFGGPHIDEAAKAAFARYVRCRWPIHVFAVDPVTQDQNVADSFSRRRETQLALSLAFASGRINASSFTRLARRTELDMESIALNRTVIGFSHGSDMFGWRFYPRVQAPRIRSNISTWFHDNLIGPPDRDGDLMDRELEPGIRECTALVIVPSFLPRVMIDTRSNWFNLTNPKRKELSLRDSMELSRSIVDVRRLAGRCAKDVHRYRDGAVWRLQRAVRQLDARLPLQTAFADVPIENTHGGFELFSAGVTDFGPELHGFYGVPGVKTENGSTTTVFLVGDNFSVLDTKVVAGNQDVSKSVELLSRQVMKIEIPGNVHATSDGIDVHVATPYGVSAHLNIPLAARPVRSEASTFSWEKDLEIIAYIKYKPNGDVAEFHFEKEDRELGIAVSDDGTGHPFGYTEAEFAAFFQIMDAGGNALHNKAVLGPVSVTLNPARKSGSIQFKSFSDAIRQKIAALAKSQRAAKVSIEGYIRLKGDKQPVFRMGKSLAVKLEPITDYQETP